MAAQRAFMQALRRALMERMAETGRLTVGRARPGVGKSLMLEAREAANVMDGLSNYALITGGVGALGGGLMSAADEESQDGTPEQINEAALYGGRAGGIGGPLAFGPAVGLTAAIGPVGASPIVPWALYTSTEGQRPRRERERKAMEEESLRRALEMRMREMHR